MESLQKDARFFAILAAAMVALTFVAFSTTYLLPVTLGRFSGEPVLHVHGILFLAWPLWFLAQSLSISRSRRMHRGLGLAGISLATAMVLTGLSAIGTSIAAWDARGVGPAGQTVSIVAMGGVVMFALFFGLGIAKVRDRIAHPRLMFLATLAIMQGAWGRLALLALLGGNPEMLRPGLMPPPPEAFYASIPHFAIDLAILAIVAWHDRRTHGSVQRITWIGGGALLAMLVARHWFAETTTWSAIARFLAEF
jgi:hypothetical protein